jgi:RNA polymerase sigma-70 factor (ECF subfamily)
MGFGLEERSAEDARIREAMQGGDRGKALHLLMSAYGTQLFSVCVRMLTDRTLAEDVHQTCFVQAYESLERVLQRESVAAWLMAIARNRCLDALKIQRRRRRWQILHGVLPEVHDGRSTLEDELHHGSVAQLLRRALDVLSPDARSTVELRFFDSSSYEEISERCAVRPGTAQMRVARAMPLLRRTLEAQGITGA